jgi:hypothetical protein
VSDWLKQLIQEKAYQSDLAAEDRRSDKLSGQHSPILFRRLSDQVGRDVKVYNESGYEKVELDFTEVSFTVLHSTFPHVKLEVRLDGEIIRYTRTHKLSTSAEESHVDGEIFVEAERMDRAYYSIKGARYANEDKVSEFLLEPVLRAV